MIIYGKQLFFYVLEKHSDKLKEIYLAKECDKSVFRKIASLNLPIKKVDFKKAQSLAKGGNHQGFLALCDDIEPAKISDLKDKNFITILYGLSDVGNIGAITRTAYALGCDGIVVVGKANLQGIARSSSGAIFDIPIAFCDDVLSLINELKQVGFCIYASKSGEKSDKFSGKIALVMGSEGDGLPSKVLKKCDKTIGIKMKNDFDSLNVSVAFAILCDRIVNG